MGVHIKKLKMSINHRGLEFRVTWGIVQGFFLIKKIKNK
jgi:hypothetical protein